MSERTKVLISCCLSSITFYRMETSPPVLQDSAFPSLSSIHSTQSNGNLNNSNLIPPLAPSHPISRKISDILTLHHHPLQTKAALEEIANLYPLDGSSDLVQKRELEEQEESSEEEEDDDEAGSNRNKLIARVDTQKARKNLEKDTDFNIEKATDDFLEVLRGVDQVSRNEMGQVADWRVQDGSSGGWDEALLKLSIMLWNRRDCMGPCRGRTPNLFYPILTGSASNCWLPTSPPSLKPALPSRPNYLKLTTLPNTSWSGQKD